MTRAMTMLWVPLALVACTKSNQHKPAATTAAATAGRKILFYRNPMNASDTSPAPMKDSMGMDYLPVYADQAGGLLEMDSQRQRLIGLATVAARLAPLQGGIRTSGRITADERRMVRVTARFEGYVEKLYADFTGKAVKQGDPLVAIYSPELLATEEEYLLAVRAGPSLAQSGLPDAAQAARDRLQLFGIPSSAIDRLGERGAAEHALTLAAPISGFITMKNVVAGSRVQPNDPLFEIIDLSRVWVLADVYENELPRLKIGQKATLTLAYWPDKKWTGRVSYILPIVDDKTRTVKARIEIANPANELKPEMFGDVVIDTAPRRALVVPDDAVIVTGTRKLVFVALGEGRLQPRAVETGAHLGGVYEITSGLQPGDQVATGASFLLDSEAQLRSATSALTSPDGSAP
jgi:Cu(I)/Ag(I) efflux system membrane fusion protein